MKFLKPNRAHFRHGLKTATAAVAAYAITEMLELPQGYWAVVSVILVMQTNLGGSMRAGMNRIMGTALGATLGAIVLLLLGTNPLEQGIELWLCILLCAYYIHVHEAFRMAGMTAVIVILMGQQSPSVVGMAFSRFFEITVGVCVALFFTAFVWPSRAGRQLKAGVVRALHDEAALYSILLTCRLGQDCDAGEEAAAILQLEKTRERNHLLLEEAKREPGGLGKSDHITVSLCNFTERIAEHLLSMEHAVHHEELEELHGFVAREMDLLAQTTITAMTRLALAIGQDRLPGPMDDVARAIADAEDALSRLRVQSVLPGYRLEVVMRFFSYYYNMREVAVELTGMAGRAALLEES
jgi:uncharacterized membrane protein YccC